jgi:hypothetical protein
VQVFEQVRLARPRKVYLYQDGPREGRPTDVDGIRQCREIAENIDWECEVHRLYQERSIGCDPSGCIAQTWLFENEETGIVLEDDVVPSLNGQRLRENLASSAYLQMRLGSMYWDDDAYRRGRSWSYQANPRNIVRAKSRRSVQSRHSATARGIRSILCGLSVARRLRTSRV